MTGILSLLVASVVWQIGVKDGSDKDFLFRYNAWEYGNAPYVLKQPQFNPKTHVWRHVIGKNCVYPNAMIPECLVPIYEAEFMNPDEIICGLELVWKEDASGFRKFTAEIREYANWCAIEDNGIEIVADDGRRQVWSLPHTKTHDREKLKCELAFNAHVGENRILIYNRSKAKHYKIWFDALRLETLEKDEPPTPYLEAKVKVFSGIVHPNDPAELEVKSFNKSEGDFIWRVNDYWGREIEKGIGRLEHGQCSIPLPTETRGWFEVWLKAEGMKTAKTTYVVTEPVEIKSIPESRFGCHAIEADSYRLHANNAFRNEFYETAARRASLGGARWARLHSISWALREPEKGKYVLDDLDRVFSRVEKYKMNILLTTGATPLWTSTSTNRNLTCCGAYSYLYYPPKDWDAWGDFMREVVRRYGNRISDYEIGNEPGYTSAFWTCGDAAAFGKYLKTAYDAIKSIKPNAVVYPGAPLNVDFIDEATRGNGGKPSFDVLSAHYLGNLKRNAEMPMRWKGFLRKYGMKETYVNSEDMSWSGYGKTFGDNAGAAALVRSHVRDAATGATRTFAFCSFGDLSDSYSFFTVRDEPKSFFAAYRAMTHQLEYAKYMGSLSGAEYEAYVFDRKGTPVTVVWRSQKGDVRLNLGKTSVKEIDLMDVEKTLASDNGLHSFAVDTTPVYVVGGDIDFLRDQIDARSHIPERVELRPGASRTLTWRSDKLVLSVPATASDGLYDENFVATIRGQKIAYPVLMEVMTPGRGVNRVANGNFEKGSSYWYFPQDTNRFSVVKNEGYLGSSCARTRGCCHFGMAGSVKVRPGETYLVSCRARGKGLLGAVLSKSDANNNSLSGKACINLLASRVTSQWKRYSEIVHCSEPTIASIKLSFLPNYGDREGKNTIDIDDVVVARLTESVSETKALNEGHFSATIENAQPMTVSEADQVVVETSKTPWRGKDDLSASCRVALDSQNLILVFDVKDSHRVYPIASNHFHSYKADSVQFAIDPYNDGRDFTSFMLGRDANGRDFLFKSANYTTPELPENVTRNGNISSAKIEYEERKAGYRIRATIPINEVYPLKGDQREFGFAWLVNDDDGDGRKYIEWASGIGRGNSATKFGVLTR